ncbi:ROK family transcriptional regulator [Sulfobacillus sp. hq2]|uniref:ROK family transcriptional regulator n=1 Tax=Sulfobacillus TaxID=28033 RepID=UPI000CD1E7DA|nr:ROK family transcriptional regulator [Sulfobacillus sp. hq2]POB09404.1 MarR family transcriptional regulator [Sulfobacillus sp. hq2]
MPISVARHSLMRQMNDIAVLTVVRQNGPTSRRRIAEILGLTKSTVTVATQRLLQKHILTEVGSVSAGPGHPERLLDINPTGGFIIGAAIDVGSYHVILFDLQARIIRQTIGYYDLSSPPEKVLESIGQDAAAFRQDIDQRRYLGFGISIPGIISTAGDVIYAPNIRWTNVPMRDFFVQLFGEPVFIVNDANAGAVGEYFFGEAQHSELLLYLSLGMGIGGGAVVEGNLMQGATGAGTEVGHMVIVENGPLCRCGRHGCFEAMASVRALTERAMRTADVRQWIELDHILTSFAAGEDWAVRAVEETLTYLKIGLANVANIYDPDMIILGGPLSHLGEFLRHEIDEAVNARGIAEGRRQIAVQTTSLGDLTSVFGAGAMVLHTAIETRVEA